MLLRRLQEANSLEKFHAAMENTPSNDSSGPNRGELSWDINELQV